MIARYVEPALASGRVLVRDAAVVDTRDGGVTAHRDILLENGLIAAITSSAGADHASDAAVIDAHGAFVVPGLVDAHAHPLNDPSTVEGAYALMLAHGITGFRQMAGSDELLRSRAARTLPVFSGAPALLALCGDLLTPLNAGTPDAARAAVRHQKASGADFVKSAMMTAATQLAALDEGRRVGIRVAGHLPEDLDPRMAAQQGMLSIEHLGPGPSVFAAVASDEAAVREAAGSASGPRLPSVRLPLMDRIVGRLIRSLVVNPATRTSPQSAHALALADAHFDDGAARALARVFVEHGTWQCPTLIRVHTQQMPDEHVDDPRVRYMHPAEVARWRRSTARFDRLAQSSRDALAAHWQAQQRLVRIFDEEGVPLLAGTDACGAGWVIPGFALHDEFDMLAASGVPPLRILQSATLAPARFFEQERLAGTVEVGRRADLVLLDADPTVDHRALHGIRAVVRDGAVWSRAELDSVLARVEADPRTR